MEKRVLFRSSWLPWALLAPQLIIVGVFFFWPAGQALVQSLQQQDAFGNSITWVGLDNFRALWNDSTYMASFQTTIVFSVLVTVLGLSIALLLAVFADRVVRGSRFYRSVLILPYAVAPVVTGCCGRSCSPRPSASWPTGSRRWASAGTTCSTATTPWRWS
jgi:sn-glycerol 3-phosphate transport system permease protein